jgi:hypothetical protein
MSGTGIATAAPLFVPDAYVPAQQPARHPAWTAERRLLAAVLDEARGDLAGPCIGGDHGPASRVCPRCDAAAWVAAEDTVWPFSFPNICTALGLDVHAARGAVLAAARCGRPLVRSDPRGGRSRSGS